MENKAIELAEYLEGTCKSLHDGMTDLEIEEDQPIKLDEIVFEWMVVFYF